MTSSQSMAEDSSTHDRTSERCGSYFLIGVIVGLILGSLAGLYIGQTLRCLGLIGRAFEVLGDYGQGPPGCASSDPATLNSAPIVVHGGAQGFVQFRKDDYYVSFCFRMNASALRDRAPD